jgi:hypothetical protein
MGDNIEGLAQFGTAPSSGRPATCDNRAMPRFDVVQQRLRNQLLVGAQLAAPADVVRWFGAVQSQDLAAAKWAVAQRTSGALDRDVERAYAEGAIVRTHVLRPTWHFVVPADLRWMLALTAPRVKQAMSYWDRQLGLDERLVGRSNDAIAEALAGDNHLTRAELGAVLAKARIEATGQRLGHLMARAELDAVVCSGPRRGKQFTYALFDERCPATRPIAREEALGTLATRYFASHGPAQLADFAWWSGLAMADARRAIAVAQPQLAFHTHDHQTYWFVERASAPRTRKPAIHLLPNFDEYLVAYRHRDIAIDAAVPGQLRSRLELLSPVIVRNGKVIGTWRRTPDGAVATRLLVTLQPTERAALAAAVERFGRFLDKPARPAKRAPRGSLATGSRRTRAGTPGRGTRSPGP